MFSLRNLSFYSLVLVLLVVVAGSTVRTTGSGMGCPDWPKCFGHLIPPTSTDQVLWAPGTEFEKGTMAIYQDTLWINQVPGPCDTTFNRSRWEAYLVHDYSTFVVAHTWIEYINRLSGALSGIPALLLLFLAFLKRKTQPAIFWISLLGLIGLGFEAWLGKKVVDGNLIPGQISIHMLGALFICGLYTHAYAKTGYTKRLKLPAIYLWFWLTLLVLQLILGIQVREGVDHLIHLSGNATSEAIHQIPYFNFHRSLIWVWLASLIFAWIKLGKKGKRVVVRIAAWFVLQAGLGLSISLLGLPHFLQVGHLFLSFVLFCYLIYQLSKRVVA